MAGSPSDPGRKRMREEADLNAFYARHLGRNSLEFERQEELLRDARAWAKAELKPTASAVQDVLELKERIVKKTWDEFIPKHRYHSDFQLGYRKFAAALWEEGWPSLEDHAIEVLAERTRSATNARSSNRLQRKDKHRDLLGPPSPLQTAEETGRSTFWKDRQVEFANYAVQLGKLDAFWNVEWGVWFLTWSAAPDGAVPEEHERTLNAIARKAVLKLPKSKMPDDVEPWQRWLEFMRRSGWGFRVTGNVACTEYEWDSGVKDGQPLAQVRKKQKYRTGDEWKKVYERTETGRLRRLSTRELKGKSSEELRKYYHWLENGSIKHVFEASARFCEELASRAFELEIAERLSDGPGGGGSWARVPRADWRDDAALARNPPPFLEPIAGTRLEAIAVLYKDAAAAVHTVLPQTDEQAEECLWPSLSQYARSVFDAIAKAELSKRWSGATGGFETRLRSQCMPEVVHDVCRLIIGQFLITLRQVIESLGPNQLPQIDETRRVLWRMTTEVLGGPATDNLAKRLTVDLEGRSTHWESKAVPIERKTGRTAGRPPAVAIIGEKVKELRDDLSQETFARVTKLSADVIQRAERGEATESTIRKLCKFAKSKGFSLSIDTLRKNRPQKTAKP